MQSVAEPGSAARCTQRRMQDRATLGDADSLAGRHRPAALTDAAFVRELQEQGEHARIDKVLRPIRKQFGRFEQKCREAIGIVLERGAQIEGAVVIAEQTGERLPWDLAEQTGQRTSIPSSPITRRASRVGPTSGKSTRPKRQRPCRTLMSRSRLRRSGRRHGWSRLPHRCRIRRPRTWVQQSLRTPRARLLAG